MSWFIRKREPKDALTVKKLKIPEGVWVKCEKCREIIYKTELENNMNVCPKCEHHHYLPAAERIQSVVDPGSFVEFDANLTPVDILNFKDSRKYTERLKTSAKKTGLKDAIISGRAYVGGMRTQIAALEFKFMGGSMGSVVGEKIVRSAERAIEEKTPLIIFACSGGARMQEGIISLMQMAKTSAAIAEMSEAGLLFISVLTNPTMGGVTASFAMLGDVIIAERDALIGFAGPRVIEQTIKKKLPEGFQRAEFMREKGMVDIVSHRKDIRPTIIRIVSLLSTP
ncbi:MAG: acetyl-CoA carboxylase, carboxyltransferase subunit beta [Nitrospinota bacterium]|nr:acetyl-CoA carboxylase, carboxyltransferase subunit beta [Nitrospinota bacterium]